MKKRALLLLSRILDAWHQDEVSREDFCDMFADTFEAEAERILEDAATEQQAATTRVSRNS